MGYKRLTQNTKKAISTNANSYSKENYKQVLFKLRPEVVDEFDAICKTEGVSRAEMFRRLLNIYTKLTK
ncbi:ribbon-helix-helix domain-containing protein [Aggregatibacter actinomycetemcomitans]|uniref:ribbon-helix-helix domain-containing protein n=1 Tax=Aggregatibacter actinomycetemcomitans TaxID=714 RepID=UPI00022AC113|nr:ribbon-helix-helix domain-containing protein [Aggregatibacter actinomycetemcomitans]KND83858.1 CopG family transcriptional regulator [Aggregatibacter actinomycetemcomitans serotype b str. SCC1398]KOE51654.1 CopG family transcriptional regulator [Aggregatibacter actinomycetemcomitans serotype b str. SCC4092]